MNIENTNPTVSCSILRPRKAPLEAETVFLCRRNDRFQEKLLFSLRKTTFLELEGTLGRPKRQVEDQRGATSKKEASKRQKVWLYLRNFMFFLGNIESHPRNTSQSPHWRVGLCRNRRAKKWSYHCKKRSGTRHVRDTVYFSFFLANIEFDSINTCQSRYWKVPCSKTHCFFVILKMKKWRGKTKKYGNA